MSEIKHYIDKNVWDAAIERLEFVYEEFEQVYLSVSFGKDSSLMLNMAIDVARRMNKLPVKVMYIDFEAQYKATIAHAERMFSRPEVDGYWICLPMSLRNSVSVFEPQWVCWDPAKKDLWVRDMPDNPYVVSDPSFFPFFKFAMEFEDFVVKFAEWVSKDRLTANLIAIRTDESLNRMRSLMNDKKVRYKGKWWTTKITENSYNAYPIYDWRTEDVWTAVGRNNYDYNKIYDVMYLGGISIHKARLCQPYGDDQRKGLELFQRCEPETWGKIVRRVSGANFGKLYSNTYLMGSRTAVLPEGHTWESYTNFLLETLPRYEAEWYKSKFKVFLDWWKEHGYPDGKIPDAADPKLEAERKVPSWRRLAKCILKNDKLCKSLTFSASSLLYEKYQMFKELYGE